MTYSIYGFADVTGAQSHSEALSKWKSSTRLGIFAIVVEDLHGFPLDLRPASSSIIFEIGDSSSSNVAEYLLCPEDFSPETRLPIPHKAADRLSELFALLRFAFTELNCTRMAVGLTDCNQIDEVTSAGIDDFEDVVRRDCEAESPPCRIYVISAKSM
jgi:hypothetical protein